MITDELHNSEGDKKATQNEATVHRVRLPAFIVEEEIGLGDIIKRATYAIGITPCAGCERRADKLNKWMSFHS